MSFELLRRQLDRVHECAASGTYDSVVDAVEAAATARAATDEGRSIRGRAGKKGGGIETKSQAKAVKEMQHGGSVSINENVARKVAESRMMMDVKKNVTDNQRRFLHSRLSKENLAHVEAARKTASKLMQRKNETAATSSKKQNAGNAKSAKAKRS
jgi:hypothetical protein